MAMSRDERRKIYQTERIRLKAREDFERHGPLGCGCLIVLLCLLAVGIVIFISRSPNPPDWWPKALHRPPTTQPADEAGPPNGLADPALPADPPAEPQPDPDNTSPDPEPDDASPSWVREPAPSDSS